MNTHDAFADLARYYDPLMSHVNYDRWFFTTTALADLVKEPIRHLDAACGTATLVTMLRKTGWDSMGSDLSPAMIQTGKKKDTALPLAVADLRGLPYRESFDIITCLFDSLNFLLEEEELAEAFVQLHGALRDGGILYADIITERMVTEHFEGQSWTEDNDGFTSRWASEYDKKKAIAESYVRINTGNTSVIRERVYDLPLVKRLLEKAGFDILAAFDAENWKTPRRRTTRVDLIAVKKGAPGIEKRFAKVAAQVRRLAFGD